MIIITNLTNSTLLLTIYFFFIGILKAGAAYVPVDPSFPEDRQLHILSHSRCQVVIVEEAHLNRLKGMTSSSSSSSNDGGNGVMGSNLPKILILNASTAEIKEYVPSSSSSSTSSSSGIFSISTMIAI